MKHKIARPYTTTGTMLQDFRREKHITQRKLADKLGYSSAQFISNFERGIATPPVDKLKKIFKILSLSSAEKNALVAQIVADDHKRFINQLGAF